MSQLPQLTLSNVLSKEQIIAKVRESLTTNELLDILEFKKIRIIGVSFNEVVIVEGRPHNNIRVQIKRDGESLQLFYLKITDITEG